MDPKVRLILAKLHLRAYPFPVSFFASDAGYKVVRDMLSLYAVSTAEDYIWRLCYRGFVNVPGFPRKWLGKYKRLMELYGALYVH